MAADQAGGLTMPLEPPNYDDRLIRRLRPPEVEGLVGDWQSRWLLGLRTEPDARLLQAVAKRLLPLDGVIDVKLISLGNAALRLDIRSTSHPLDPEAYPWTDAILREIDGSLGIIEINGSPRNWWRTFRSGGTDGVE